MGHKLLNVYSSRGVNTKTNRLNMPYDSWRENSKNMFINYEGNLTQRHGSEHSDAGGYVSIGEFEYIFTDVVNGEQESELLQIRTNGELYRRLAIATFTCSVDYQITFVNGDYLITFTGFPQTIVFNDAKTVAQIVSDITAFLVVGLSASSTGAGLAYLLVEGSVYGWEKVPCPVVAPFLVDWSKSEGVSSVNLNQVCYITVGSFVFKYDGRSVYRAGVPKNVTPSADVGVGTLAAGIYNYKIQCGFKDARGGVYWGKISRIFDSSDYLNDFPYASSGTASDVRVLPFPNALDFGTFGCISSALQETSINPAGDGATITVEAGHNVLAGMCLMIPSFIRSTAATAGKTGDASGYFSAKVLSVTVTTITLEKGVPIISLPAISGTLLEFQSVSASYVAKKDENAWLIDQSYQKFSNVYQKQHPPYGMFVRIWRSKVGDQSNFYRVYDMSLPRVTIDGGAGRYDQKYLGIYDNQPDTALTENLLDGLTGEEIPRACRYLASWQNTIVQAGLPDDYQDYLTTKILPFWRDQSYYPSGWFSFGGGTLQTPSNGYYTEVYLCDAQSIYWADSLNEEGFPQDGSKENRFQNKFNDRIKGMRENKDAMFAFKEKSTCLMSGSPVGDINVEFLESDAGLIDHRSIADVEGQLVWADPYKGFWSCIAGRLPMHIGEPISDQFVMNKISKDYAVACNWFEKDLYICVMPSRTFVYDYSAGRGFWYQWDFTSKSILSTAEGKCFISSGSQMSELSDIARDHRTAIDMDIRSAWINFDKPTIDKNFHRAFINSIQGGFTLTVEQYANYLQTKIGSIAETFQIEPSKKTIKREVKLNPNKLSSISIGFKHNVIGEKVLLQGWELEYSTDFDTGEPKK